MFNLNIYCNLIKNINKLYNIPQNILTKKLLLKNIKYFKHIIRIKHRYKYNNKEFISLNFIQNHIKTYTVKKH